jgi:adenylate kinase family enzyme
MVSSKGRRGPAVVLEEELSAGLAAEAGSVRQTMREDAHCMTRIHVTGNAGVGKSTLAARIGHLLDLPVFGLDEIVWKPGWAKTDPDERDIKERVLCSRPAWVIEGVSRNVREAADVIVFLDYPRRVSFWRCAKRNWRYLFKSRPGLPPNCPELLIIPKLVRIIWTFRVRARPVFFAEFAEWKDQKTAFHIRSDSELDALLTKLEQSHRRTIVCPDAA